MMGMGFYMFGPSLISLLAGMAEIAELYVAFWFDRRLGHGA